MKSFSFRAKIYHFGYPFVQALLSILRWETAGALCAVAYQNKLLFVRNTYGDSLWCFPGGGIKSGEAPADAAARELMEEVGIKVSQPCFMGAFTCVERRRKDTVHVFYAEVEQDIFKIDPGEILEARWFAVDEIPMEKLSYVGKRALELVHKGSPRAAS